MPPVSWPTEEAERLLKAVQDSNETIVFETGYGPSGRPHIGTFAENARTCFVVEALKHKHPELKTEVVVFSDDLDGLRSLPENVPNHDMLTRYLGAPLTSVPDPYGEQPSYAAYMNAKLREFLDSFGFSYTFRSSTETYQQGLFDAGLKNIMDHYDAIRNIFIATIAEEKREQWSPFFPICSCCGKIYTTSVLGVDPAQYTIHYRCDRDSGAMKSCGHEETMEITGGRVKVGWKVDWALRWHTLKVKYEMHGKDLIDSVKVSSKICRILGSPPPVTYKYELFLDENGQKISKKIGNGISLEQWMDYAPLGSLLNFLLGNPNKPKKMGLPLLSKIIDEYLQLVRSEDTGSSGTALWYLREFQKQREGILPQTPTNVAYSLLVNVAESLGVHEGELLLSYAMQYDPSISNDRAFYLQMCEQVVRFVEDYQATLPQPELTINRDFAPHLSTIRDYITQTYPHNALDGDEVQRFLFGITKEHNINQRQWFQFLYSVILGKDRGPKMGPFFAMLGKERTLALIDKAIQEHA